MAVEFTSIDQANWLLHMISQYTDFCMDKNFNMHPSDMMLCIVINDLLWIKENVFKQDNPTESLKEQINRVIDEIFEGRQKDKLNKEQDNEEELKGIIQ